MTATPFGRRQLTGLAILAALAAAVVLAPEAVRGAGGDKKAATDSVKLFQGNWDVAKVSKDGVPIPEEIIKEVKVTFKGTDLFLVVQGAELKASVTVDGSKKPQEINMQFEAGAGDPSFGIFEFEGDSVKIYASEVKDQRPKDFKADAPIMIVLKRAPVGKDSKDGKDGKDAQTNKKGERQRTVALAVGIAPTSDPQTKTDKDKLQGTWTIVKGTHSGVDIPPEMIGKIKATFDGEKVTITAIGKEAPPKSGTHKLDEKANPRQIDLTLDGRTGLGIYQLEGDTLKLCVADPDSPRPSEFKADAAVPHIIMVFEREKAVKKSGAERASTPFPNRSSAAASDLERMQGSWRPTLLRFDNQQLPDEFKQIMQQTTIAIGDGKINLSLLDLAMEGVFRLDPSKSPKQIDLTLEDTKLKGIYELTGDKLRICGAEPGKARPTTFNADADIILELQRVANGQRRHQDGSGFLAFWLPTGSRGQDSFANRVASSTPSSPQGDKQAKKTDKELIQGAWLVESAIDDGADLGAEFRDLIRFHISGDAMVVKIGELEDKGTFKVDETKKPKTVDVTLESGNNLIGIYEFVGDKVKLCMVDQGQPRPTEFKSAAGSSHKLVTLARVKEEKKKAPQINELSPPKHPGNPLPMVSQSIAPRGESNGSLPIPASRRPR